MIDVVGESDDQALAGSLGLVIDHARGLSSVFIRVPPRVFPGSSAQNDVTTRKDQSR